MDRDRLELVTPEGVSLELELAGVGSRAVAGFIDLLIQGIAIFALFVLLPFSGSDVLTVIGGILALVALLIGYHLYFELFGNGRTPGKRAMKLRAVRVDGGPLRLQDSLIRTLLRIVDILPTMYLIGAVSIFVSTRNQRLGDLAGGTVVVREKPTSLQPLATTDWRMVADRMAPGANRLRRVEGWDVSAVTAQELALVRQYLRRRVVIGVTAADRIGADLAARLEPKVSRPPGELPAVSFLQGLIDAADQRAE